MRFLNRRMFEGFKTLAVAAGLLFGGAAAAKADVPPVDPDGYPDGPYVPPPPPPTPYIPPLPPPPGGPGGV